MASPCFYKSTDNHLWVTTHTASANRHAPNSLMHGKFNGIGCNSTVTNLSLATASKARWNTTSRTSALENI